jgi:hypothetical protein
MTAPVITSGGALTVNRKWVLEVNIGSAGSPNWQACEFVQNFVPNTDEANWQDSSTYGDGGYTSQAKTAAAWSANATLMRKIMPGTITYGPVQEYLRTKSIGVFGPSNQVQVRFFEFDTNDTAGTVSPRVEAYMGYAGVQWAEQGGTLEGASTVQVTLQSQSKLALIAHPYPVAGFVPVIDSATPLALLAAGGQLVKIYGRGFTGVLATTGVKFAGTNSPTWSVDNDSQITAVTPAHTAGSGPILVTNATGPSTTGPTVTYS